MFSKELLIDAQKLEQQWQAECQQIYGTKEYQATTGSGIPTKPVYTPTDIDDLDYKDISMPGIFPYTRGIHPLMYQYAQWATQQGLGYGLPENTRERYDLLRKEGMEGYIPQYFIVNDAVAQHGYDPDHPAGKGQVGRCGTSWCHIRDYEILFHDLPLDRTGVVLGTFDTSAPALAMYVVCAERMGYPPHILRGHTINCAYRQTAMDLPSFAPEYALKVVAELIKYCVRHVPKWAPISFQGFIYHTSGANAIQEVAFALAPAIAVTETCMELGLHPDEFVSRYGFHFAADDDFFETVAKIRAFRRIWAKLAKERFGCKKPKSQQPILQIETSTTSLTAQQPLNNIIRATLQTLAAVLSGPNSIWTTHYDEGLSIPTEESAILCVRTQQIIYHESKVANIVDPLGGSYYVEWLTDRLEKEIAKLLNKIDEMGFYRCWRSGWFRKETEKSAYEWRKRLEKGESIKVGLNKYVTEEETKVPIFKVDPQVEEIAIERVKQYRSERDNTLVQNRLQELKKVAQQVKEDWPRGGDLMPALLDTVRAEATLQEIMDVLKGEFGWSFVY
jgi:methylmalonyl-CoA mutase N-terminal domain/subunit